MSEFVNPVLQGNIAKVGVWYEESRRVFSQLDIPAEVKRDPAAFAAFFQGVVMYLTSD